MSEKSKHSANSGWEIGSDQKRDNLNLLADKLRNTIYNLSNILAFAIIHTLVRTCIHLVILITPPEQSIFT